MCTNTLPHPNGIHSLFSSVFHGIGIFLIFWPSGLVGRGEFKINLTSTFFWLHKNKIASSARRLIFSLFNFTKSSQRKFQPKKQFQWLNFFFSLFTCRNRRTEFSPHRMSHPSVITTALGGGIGYCAVDTSNNAPRSFCF
jgi:hypothetical protein